MKMTMGSTWKAKTTPNGPLFAPSGRRRRNSLPASAYSSMAFTPRSMRLKHPAEVGLQHQEGEGELQPQAPSNQARLDRAPVLGEQIGNRQNHDQTRAAR